MKWTYKIMAVLAVLVLMPMPVLAQPELPNPGITPDSPFYFVERVFDVFRSDEAVMDKRAAEIVAMAEKGHEKGLAKAIEGYERAVEKRQRAAEKNENSAEEITRQASNHLAILSDVKERVPEQARKGIDKALNESMRGRENALVALRERNQERATIVAQATIQEVMANTPEEAQEGLQKAIEAMKRKGAPENVSETPSEDYEDIIAEVGEQGTEAINEKIPETDTPTQKDTTINEQENITGTRTQGETPTGIPGN